MPVIINMEMPKGCEIAGARDCPLSPVCTARKKEIWKHGTLGDHIIDYYPPNCPIVGEIPDKHGDLKDTADIMQRYEHEMVKLKAELPKEQYEQIFHVFHVFIKPWIDQAPTVLEASR